MLQENEQESVVWDFNRLLSRIKRFVFEDIELPNRLFASLSEQNIEWDITKDELMWLQLCSDWLKRVSTGMLSSGILYYFYKFNSFTTTRKLAAKMGVRDCHVHYWLKKYEQLNLIGKRNNKADGRSFYYVINKDFVNIHKIISELITEKHGEDNLKSMFRLGNPVTKLQEQGRMAFRRYYAKKKKGLTIRKYEKKKYLPTGEKMQSNVFYKEL